MGRNTVSDYDYIIVGAGSAGCAIASRLSEDPAVDVLLLEAGGADDDERISTPHRAWELWTTPFDWGYTTAPQVGALDRPIYWPRGKVLGGSSCLNAMIYVRGAPADYDHWAYLGNAGWDYESVLPYFKKSEDYYGGASRYHGAGGPLSVSRNTAPNPLTGAFIDAAMQPGHPINHDFSGPDLTGVGYTDTTTTPDGRRCSAAVAFLKPAYNRRNLTVQTGAHSHSLVIEKGHWALSMNAAASFIPRAPRAKSSSAPAPSARRTFCSCPVSARRTISKSSASASTPTSRASGRTCTIIF
jgi:choline dehydrogenase